MRKILTLMLALLLVASLVACGNASKSNGTASPASSSSQSSVENDTANSSGSVESKKPVENAVKVASDGAQMQTENPKMPTRLIKNGTKINMHFGDVIIPGLLNDSETAQALIKMLPYTVHVSRYSHDFCGVMNDPLPYSEENVHYGWLNGDIDFATDANYFTILFEDEKSSEQYGYQVNIGVIDCELSKISELKDSYDVLIELAK